jgi:hypothetical protein
VRDSKCNEDLRISGRKMIDIIGETLFQFQDLFVHEEIALKAKMDKAPSPVEKGKV